MHIVLASGDTDMRLAIQLMLSEVPGIKITGSASNCDGLIALVKSTCPDLVLLDWELPGRKMAFILRHLKTFSPENPITLIVIGRNQDQKEIALWAGADEYILIGERPEDLLEVFQTLNGGGA
jgi:DNA-binding NarL/FixJ family response regulator